MTTYVQIENDVVLIDSRVYCRDIIQVDHHDWMNNVVYKHQSLIEKHFSLLRFENAAVKEQGARGTKYVKYVLMTEAQCNALLVFSRNVGNVPQRKIELIADFEKAKELIKQHLNKIFIAPPSNSDEIEKLNELVQTHLIESKQLAEALIRSEARVQELTEIVNQNGLQSDKSTFDYDLDFLWDVTGIKSRGYLIGILLENFKSGVDFITTPDLRPRKGGLPKTKYWITKQCHDLLVIALRSLRGVDVSDLPETLHIDRDAFFRESNSKKANARFGKKK